MLSSNILIVMIYNRTCDIFLSRLPRFVDLSGKERQIKLAVFITVLSLVMTSCGGSSQPSVTNPRASQNDPLQSPRIDGDPRPAQPAIQENTNQNNNPGANNKEDNNDHMMASPPLKCSDGCIIDEAPSETSTSPDVLNPAWLVNNQRPEYISVVARGSYQPSVNKQSYFFVQKDFRVDVVDVSPQHNLRKFTAIHEQDSTPEAVGYILPGDGRAFAGDGSFYTETNGNKIDRIFLLDATIPKNTISPASSYGCATKGCGKSFSTGFQSPYIYGQTDLVQRDGHKFAFTYQNNELILSEIFMNLQGSTNGAKYPLNIKMNKRPGLFVAELSSSESFSVGKINLHIFTKDAQSTDKADTFLAGTYVIKPNKLATGQSLPDPVDFSQFYWGVFVSLPAN